MRRPFSTGVNESSPPEIEAEFEAVVGSTCCSGKNAYKRGNALLTIDDPIRLG